MLALERTEEGKAKLDEVYAKALGAGFSTPAEHGVVIGAYLDFMRRRCGKIQKTDGEFDDGGSFYDRIRIYRFDMKKKVLGSRKGNRKSTRISS